MYKLPLYCGRKGALSGMSPHVMVDDEDFPGLQKLGLDYWFEGDNRTHIPRRFFRTENQRGERSGIYIFCHRVIALVMEAKRYPESLTELLKWNENLGPISILDGEAPWDCRRTNILMRRKGKKVIPIVAHDRESIETLIPVYEMDIIECATQVANAMEIPPMSEEQVQQEVKEAEKRSIDGYDQLLEETGL